MTGVERWAKADFTACRFAHQQIADLVTTAPGGIRAAVERGNNLGALAWLGQFMMRPKTRKRGRANYVRTLGSSGKPTQSAWR